MPNPRSPKFPNFLEHHKPFPSNKRGAHRAGCVIILKGVCNNTKKRRVVVNKNTISIIYFLTTRYTNPIMLHLHLPHPLVKKRKIEEK